MAKTFLLVAGARPNFMKIAPIMRAADERQEIRTVLVHTGQHYDQSMAGVFFEQLGIPAPDHSLDVGSGSHAQVTARVMTRLEPVLVDVNPNVTIVVGDVNSTVGAAITAAKLQIPVAHVEAGLRSFDRSMPEEINRVLTDSVSDFFFVTEPAGFENLRNEGIPAEKVHHVGNTMIDTLIFLRDRAAASTTLDDLPVSEGEYVLLTLHRPGNVDEVNTFAALLERILAVAERAPVVFPVHPRTRASLEQYGLWEKLERNRRVTLLPPAAYLDFLKLMMHARFVVTDSGGIQEETTYLGVPCLTCRDNTERPATIDEGTNVLVGSDGKLLDSEADAILSGTHQSGNVPRYWDGGAGKRIVETLG